MYNYAEREKERERERESERERERERKREGGPHHSTHRGTATSKRARGEGQGPGLQSVHMAEGAKFMPQYSPAPTYSSTQELRLHLLVDLDSHRHDV